MRRVGTPLAALCAVIVLFPFLLDSAPGKVQVGVSAQMIAAQKEQQQTAGRSPTQSPARSTARPKSTTTTTVPGKAKGKSGSPADATRANPTSPGSSIVPSAAVPSRDAPVVPAPDAPVANSSTSARSEAVGSAVEAPSVPSTHSVSQAVKSATAPAVVEIPRPQRYARLLFDALNAERQTRSLPALAWNEDLAREAREWSGYLSSTGSFKHQNLGALASGELSQMWALGENIARGGSTLSALGVHDAWMKSAGHRKNILNPQFDSVGIGVVCLPNGRLYATQEFGRVASFDGPVAMPATPKASPRAQFKPNDISCAKG